MTAPAATRAVVFDLDGTLVDSAPDIAAALSRALDAHRLPPVTTQQTRGLLGGGARTLVAEALRTVGGSAALLDPVLTAYTEAYAADTSSRTSVYADAREAVVRLRGEGWRVGVCTNKRTGPARRVLADTGLADAVDVVIGIDAVPAGKPDPGHLWAVLERLGVAAQDAVYVGDTETDALAARHAGVRYRHVAWGRPVADTSVIDRFASLLTTPPEDS